MNSNIIKVTPYSNFWKDILDGILITEKDYNSLTESNYDEDTGDGIFYYDIDNKIAILENEIKLDLTYCIKDIN